MPSNYKPVCSLKKVTSTKAIWLYHLIKGHAIQFNRGSVPEKKKSLYANIALAIYNLKAKAINF